MAVTDRVTIITGAGGPLGLAAGRAFRAAGTRLVLVVRSREDARRLQEEYRGAPVLVEQADLAEDDLEAELAGNLRSVFLMCRAVVPHLTGQGWGRIINLGARSGLQGRARAAAHAVAKGGVILLTEALADELKAAGVTANVLIPSVIDTPANRRIWPNADFSAWVPPEQLAATMLFLCSDEAAAITGARISVPNRV